MRIIHTLVNLRVDIFCKSSSHCCAVERFIKLKSGYGEAPSSVHSRKNNISYCYEKKNENKLNINILSKTRPARHFPRNVCACLCKVYFFLRKRRRCTLCYTFSSNNNSVRPPAGGGRRAGWTWIYRRAINSLAHDTIVHREDAKRSEMHGVTLPPDSRGDELSCAPQHTLLLCARVTRQPEQSSCRTTPGRPFPGALNRYKYKVKSCYTSRCRPRPGKSCRRAKYVVDMEITCTTSLCAEFVFWFTTVRARVGDRRRSAAAAADAVAVAVHDCCEIKIRRYYF